MPKRAVFLDRDGVINEVLTDRVKFVNKREDLHFLPRVPEAIKMLNDSGLFDLIAVITNQGGVGLGYMKEKELQDIHEYMVNELKKLGAEIDEVCYCPHKPKEGCACRKPGSKMIEDVAKEHGIDLSASYMVGDREPDIEAGQNVGTKTVFLGEEYGVANATFPTLYDAAHWIIQDAKQS
ncbi:MULTISPECIES: D-glycero-alpha-D-manno-heptose-1,7-bisphosphate 7-phosphatase [Pontibacillus]|uniref:D,D-heptose 1,7-bisphosphate phosphatase n=1 Tax=Pontibacillus chungwhensis TaxID=265426 RepID=A0ABY8UZX3_9BACI|nr:MULTISPECIES: HAD family hydrolase [Pontibacillus]MCD5324638.1 HAD family hydrolase [Pontibacillus sp. HN14]WIF99067.1 HAD family hydrolase [Pontibacillus chungwhensis]